MSILVQTSVFKRNFASINSTWHVWIQRYIQEVRQIFHIVLCRKNNCCTHTRCFNSRRNTHVVLFRRCRYLMSISLLDKNIETIRSISAGSGFARGKSTSRRYRPVYVKCDDTWGCSMKIEVDKWTTTSSKRRLAQCDSFVRACLRASLLNLIWRHSFSHISRFRISRNIARVSIIARPRRHEALRVCRSSRRFGDHRRWFDYLDYKWFLREIRWPP